MASTYSFDVVSEYDKAEMNNVLDQVQREVETRYDFKGSNAAIEWLDADKSGFKITGDNQFHLDAIIEMVRIKAAKRGISQKTFDTSKETHTNNMKTTWDILFKKGLDKERAKKVTNFLREKLPKIKAQIQGEEVRIMSPKKDELQDAMTALKSADFDFPLDFTNFR
jgi:cyclic-di-GMP-binding protein